jgi:hypothetical protein
MKACCSKGFCEIRVWMKDIECLAEAEYFLDPWVISEKSEDT